VIRYSAAFFCLTTLGLATTNDVLAKDTIRDSIVKIYTTSRAPDFYRPWTKQNPAKSSGSGVLIALGPDAKIPAGQGPLILTNAHVVRYASQIYVQPNQTTDKYLAQVVAVAPGIDLAVLRLKDPEVLAGNSPLLLADDFPSVKETVNVYGFPMGGNDLSVTEGIVSRIEFSKFYYETYGVRIQVDAALNPGNSGGPAVAAGRVVGLVFSGIRTADNIGYLIPADEIRLFFADIEDGNYDGKPWLLDYFQSAENESLRKRVGLSKKQTGIVVTIPYSDDQSYPLRRWDVITQIGPYALDNLGMVQIRDDLRLRFSHFLSELVDEGRVPITILRKGEEQKVELPVITQREKLLPLLKHNYPEYAIFGPLVLTTLSKEYAQAALSSKRGIALMSYRQSPIISRLDAEPEFSGEELVIVANRMFPHPIKKGYENPTLNVVEKLNGQPVENLAHLIEMLRDSSDEYLEFEFAGYADTLVFLREELLEANETILESEGIRYQFSPRLRKVWNAKEN